MSPLRQAAGVDPADVEEIAFNKQLQYLIIVLRTVCPLQCTMPLNVSHFLFKSCARQASAPSLPASGSGSG